MSKAGVSIIICTFNGKDRLLSTLNALEKLEPMVSKELILVDNSSTDDTCIWVQDYFKTGKLGFPARYVFEPNPGLIYARIAGIKSASFDLVLFCDDDNSLSPDYLSLGFTLFNSNNAMGVLGGYGIPVLEGIEPEWLSRYQKSFALGPQAEQTGKIQDKPGHVYGAASFFRKKPLLDLIHSGYHFYLTGRSQTRAISGDDLELCWLMQLMGYEIHYSDELKFYHVMPKSRMNTSYLIKMKSGTAAGSALLFSYRYFIQLPTSPYFNFTLGYFFQSLKTSLIYLKNLFIKPKGLISWERKMALSILDSQWVSFFTKYSEAKTLFLQLKSKKEFWKLNP